MFILRLILILIGLLFIGFGYAIWFKGKYNLINNFESNRRRGILDDSYAKRVGLTEFIGGIACFALGTIAMFLGDDYTLIFFILCIIGIIAALIFNQVRSTRHNNSAL